MKFICHSDASPSNYFSFGAKAPMLNLYEEDLNKIKEEGYTVVLTGLGRLRLIEMLESHKINYIFLDRGYLFGEKKHWIRMSYNSFQMQELKKIKFWRNNIQIIPEPWKKNENGYILLCPPGEKTMKRYNLSQKTWTTDTIAEIRKYTDKEIVIRNKPTLKYERYHGENSLKNALNDAYCIVVYNSNAATEAIFSGTPALVLGDAASKFVARRKIKDIENLIYPNRIRWLKNIMCNQFTRDEIASGEAIDFFLKFNGLTL